MKPASSRRIRLRIGAVARRVEGLRSGKPGIGGQYLVPVPGVAVELECYVRESISVTYYVR
jgi:hypothetical protein